jgi:uncharacterized protein (TIGR02996 family)
LHAIYDEPFDVVPRRVYADWLEEHAAPVHAALVRYQARQGEPASPPKGWLDRLREEAPCPLQLGLSDGLLLHMRLKRELTTQPRLVTRLVNWMNRHHIHGVALSARPNLGWWFNLPLWSATVRLELSGVALNEGNVATLIRSEYLRDLLDLDLSFTQMTENSLRRLLGQERWCLLRALDLSGLRLPEWFWPLFVRWPVMQQLARLRLRDVNWRPHALEAIRDGPSLPSLRELVIGPLEPGVEILCQWTTLPGLQSLSLYYPRLLRVDRLLTARWWPQLRFLAILQQTLDDSILALADGLPPLCRLLIPREGVSDARAASLERRLERRLEWA